MSEGLILETIYGNMHINQEVEDLITEEGVMFDVYTVNISIKTETGPGKVVYRGVVSEEQSTNNRLVCNIVASPERGDMIIVDAIADSSDLNVYIQDGGSVIERFKSTYHYLDNLVEEDASLNILKPEFT